MWCPEKRVLYSQWYSFAFSFWTESKLSFRYGKVSRLQSELSCKFFALYYPDSIYCYRCGMGLEQKLNKWLIGAVMGRKHVIEHELSQESEEKKSKEKTWRDGLKGFLELWVDELKQNVGGIKKSVPSPKKIFWKKKKEEINEDDSW